MVSAMGKQNKRVRKYLTKQKKLRPHQKEKIKEGKQIKKFHERKDERRKLAARLRPKPTFEVGDLMENAQDVDRVLGVGNQSSEESEVDGFSCALEDKALSVKDDEVSAFDNALRKEGEGQLTALMEKDVELCQFLVQSSCILFKLHTDPEQDCSVESPETSLQKNVEMVLTLDRFHLICAAAKTSFIALSAVLCCYQAAARSVEKQVGKEETENGITSKGLFHLDNDATVSAVLGWSVGNILGLFQHHAQTPKAGKSQTKKDSEHPADPSESVNWTRLQIPLQSYWKTTLSLLQVLDTAPMLESILRAASEPAALAWLWPFERLHQKYFQHCCSLCSSPLSHTVRLLAFLFLRNSIAMAQRRPVSQNKIMMSHAEYFIHKVLTSFAERSSPSYSWHSVSTDRFLENCSIELLRIDDSMAYRIGYEQIKKLSKGLRANCIRKYHVDDDNAEASLKRKRGSLETEQKSGPERKKQEVVDWSFIRAIRLWTRVVSSSPALKRLAYSLSMVISGAMKVKLTDLKYFPFVFHCLACLNRLAASLEAFIPITSYLLSLTAALLHAAGEAKRQSKHGTELGSTKPKKNLNWKFC